MIHSLLITAALLTAAIEVEVQTLDGEKSTGRLTELGAQLVLETSSGPMTLDTSKLVGVTLRSEMTEKSDEAAKPQAIILLVDDSRLLAKSFVTTRGQATIELAGGNTITVPTKTIRYARFVEAAPTQAELAKQWDEILALKATGDLLVMRKKGALDYTEGLLRDIDAGTVNFELDGDSVRVKRARVEAVLYYRAAEPTLTEPRCVLHLRDSSEIAAATLELKENKLEVETSAGAKLELPVDSLSRLDYSVGKIQYLSDLEPELTEFAPYFPGPKNMAAYSAALAPRQDKNLENGPLRLAGQEYAKGLSLHSQTRLAYRLGGKYRQFTALAGIDDAVSSGGNVLLQISGDGKPLWEGTIKGGDPPQPLEIDVSGVKRLELLVGFGDDLDIGDHLDLCEAKVMK